MTVETSTPLADTALASEPQAEQPVAVRRNAPSAWTVGQVLAIARATAERLAPSDITIETDEAGLFAALREDGADVEDILRRLARASLEADAIAEATEKRMAQLADRKRRQERRSDEYRSSAHAVMQALGIVKFFDPEFTLTLSENKGGSVIITDEAAIPDEYVNVKRTPDKKKIKADIQVGVIIPGAELSQGGEPILTIRSK